MSHKKHKLAVDAVLFDLDGTLIDSAPIYYALIDVVFSRLGMQTVAVLTGFDDYEALEREKPGAIIESASNMRGMLVYD